MKNLTPKKIANYVVRAIATLVVIVIISCSMTIESVVQPMTVNGGEILPVTLNVKVETNEGQTSKFMVAILVPKMWNAAQKATVTFTSDITNGPQAMTAIPDGTAAPKGNGLNWPNLLAQKIGNGGNLINDWEWVAYYSNADLSVGGNVTVRATVSIKIPVSNDNLSFKMGYVVANSTDGLSGTDRYGTFFPGCVTVNGDGDMIDFCNPQLAGVEPRTSTDNDIITINFDAGVAANPLQNANAVYLCATGITTTGDRLEACRQVDASKLTPLGAGRWRIDIWPRSFFSVSDSQQLTRIEYFFTDADGVTKVGYGGGSDPFLYTFNCQ